MCKNAVYAEAILLLYTTYRHSAPCRRQTATVGWLKHQNLCGCTKVSGISTVGKLVISYTEDLKSSWQTRKKRIYVSLIPREHVNLHHLHSYRHDLVFVYFMKRMVTNCPPSSRKNKTSKISAVSSSTLSAALTQVTLGTRFQN